MDHLVDEWGQAPRNPGRLVVEGYGMGSLLRALARTLALSLLPWAAFIVVLLIDGCHDAWAGLAVLYVPYVPPIGPRPSIW